MVARVNTNRLDQAILYIIILKLENITIMYVVPSLGFYLFYLDIKCNTWAFPFLWLMGLLFLKTRPVPPTAGLFSAKHKITWITLIQFWVGWPSLIHLGVVKITKKRYKSDQKTTSNIGQWNNDWICVTMAWLGKG